MRPLLAPLLLVACTAPGMRALRAPAEEVVAPVPPACWPADRGQATDDVPDDVDCRRVRRRQQTWRAQRGVFGERARLVITADTGVRAIAGGVEVRDEIGAGPLAVARAARQACGDGCDGAVFLGDNLYDSGVNDPADTGFLQAFATAWGWVGPQWYVLGNHDWGTYPLLFRGGGRLGPQRERAHRQFRDLHRLSDQADLDLRGDSHFWATAAGPGRLAALDTNYLVRRCRDARKGVRCKGDPGRDREDRIALATLVERLVASSFGPMIVVGHHPWLSHGEHGAAGDYRDNGFRIWPGAPLRTLLDGPVADNAALYLSGHDHNTQVARVDPDTLSVVVGAGGKTTGPGEQTGPTVDGEPGERHLPAIEHEVFCHLGFAILDIQATAMTLDVHTLPHPDADDEDLVECRAALAERRPDLAEPPAPTCLRWRWTEGAGWDEGRTACDTEA